MVFGMRENDSGNEIADLLCFDTPNKLEIVLWRSNRKWLENRYQTIFAFYPISPVFVRCCKSILTLPESTTFYKLYIV